MSSSLFSATLPSPPPHIPHITPQPLDYGLLSFQFIIASFGLTVISILSAPILHRGRIRGLKEGKAALFPYQNGVIGRRTRKSTRVRKRQVEQEKREAAEFRNKVMKG